MLDARPLAEPSDSDMVRKPRLGVSNTDRTESRRNTARQRRQEEHDMSEESPEGHIEVALMQNIAYPEPTSKVELAQTHISYVFLTDNFVYKIKKPVNFGFLDFSTLEKRRHYCQKEVELNRRLSPDVYLGILPVTDDNGVVTIGGKGQTIDYAVKMRRIPMENLMIRLLREKRLNSEMVEKSRKELPYSTRKPPSQRRLTGSGA